MYKLKQGVNLPKEFKIKVNPEQSEALQLHLLSVGYKYGDGSVNIFKKLYFYIHNSERITFSNDYDYTFFNHHSYKQIKFKDYFEKVTNQFPKKWCIQVTEKNYKELDVWMHRNWKNYEGYTDMWQVTMGGYFMSEGNLQHTEWDINEGFTLITTEQFREKFGIVKINETEIKAIEHNLDFWHERANYYKQRCKDLRLEKYEMSKHRDYWINKYADLTSKNNEIETEMSNEIEQLKKELELFNSLKETLISIAKKD